MNRFLSFLNLAGLVCFQIGLGAASTGIVWTWLADGEGQWHDGAPLLPVVFGVALPMLLGWIPLTIASAFVISPRVRALVPWIAGAATFALIGGHLLTDRWLQDQYEFVLGIGILGLLQVCAIVLIVSEASMDKSSTKQRTIEVAVGWIAGAAITATCEFWLKLPFSLAIAVIIFALSGFLLGSSGRVQANPWISSERSIGRFARLLDLLRGEAKVRNGLLVTATLYGVLGAAVALLPVFNDGWSEVGNRGVFNIAIFGGVTAGAVLGLIIGATKWFAFPSRNWQPRYTLPALMILGIGQLCWFAFDPFSAAWLAPLPFIPLGMVARYARELVFLRLERKGVRLPLEIEALIGTLIGVALLVAALLTWVVNQSISSPFGATGFIVVVIFVAIALAFRWLKPDSPQPEESTDKEAMPLAESSSALFYLPGCGIPDHTPHANDGRAITILYDVPSSKRDDFREAMARIARVRRCQGALHWRLSQSLEKPARFTESYLLESYKDYQQVLRHESPEDLAAKQRVFELNDWDSLPCETHEDITKV